MVFPNDETEAGTTPQGEGQSPQVESTEPEYVTRAALDESLGQFREGLQELLNNNYRGIQSQTDRLQTQVAQRMSDFESQLRTMRDRGIVQMTDQQIAQAARENAIDQLLETGQGQTTNAPGQVQSGAQPQTTTPPADVNKQVNAAAEAILKEHGVTLDNNDPELSQFEIAKHAQSPNPLDYLKAMENAAKAKAERLGRQSTARAPGSIQGGPGPSNPLQNVTNLSELWSKTTLGKRNG